MIVAGGGVGGLFVAFLILVFWGIGSVIFYWVWRRKYLRLGLAVPSLKKWQLGVMYSPIILLILSVLVIFLLNMKNEEYLRYEHEKDKNRFFTIEKETVFGEIILPVGTHISKNIPAGLKYHAPRDLNNVDGIQFPDPVMINGMSVLEISPTIGFLRLAEDYHFLEQGKQRSCVKSNYLIVELNNRQYVEQYFNQGLPIPPSTFKPSLWTIADCTIKIDFPSSVPYWENGVLKNLD